MFSKELAQSLAKIKEQEGADATAAAKTKRENFIANVLNRFQTIKLMDKVLFTRYLALLLRSGVPLSRSLGILKKQFSQPAFQKIIANLKKQVEEGQELSASLKKYPRVFSDIYVNLVATGEVSGNLEQVLEQLAVQLKKDYELIKKVKGAMIYPAVILTVMTAIMTVMMITVIPKMNQLFLELELELPLVTRIVVATSLFLKKYFIFIIITIVILVPAINFIKRQRAIKKIGHSLILRLPIIGKLSRQVNLARFTHTLSVLLKSGLPIIKALEVTARALGNFKYQQALLAASKEVQTGVNLEDSLKKYPRLFPAVVTQLAEVGQETGAMDEILEKMAEFFENEVDSTVKNLSTVIEPILMIIIALGVGVVAAAVLLPVYTIIDKLE